ncbi:unnamed protein product [Linum tenue]|uniref:Uncharacterized protein n=1 Tax=Linum tenue TaxID=586396 RepID=A0AAV0KNQ3_9ROSI|nr:unnamed protein product [Linum tenue]
MQQRTVMVEIIKWQQFLCSGTL